MSKFHFGFGSNRHPETVHPEQQAWSAEELRLSAQIAELEKTIHAEVNNAIKDNLETEKNKLEALLQLAVNRRVNGDQSSDLKKAA